MTTDEHYEPTAEEYAILVAATDRAERHEPATSGTRRIWADTTAADIDRAIRGDAHRSRARVTGETAEQ